jgi:ribose transport system ATP-binding protein
VVTTQPARALTLDALIRSMVGRELDPARAQAGRAPGPVALRVEGLRHGDAVRDVSFEVRAGEILGIAGLMGSGRTETVRAVFGADRAAAGAVYLGAAARPARIRSPRDAVRQGLALVTEDRQGQGLLLPLPVRANLTLLCLRRLARGRSWVRPAAERAEADGWIRRLSVRCASAEQPVVELSGGNQQKVVIARWLARQCSVLIFDEPTRGVDVGAKFEIYRLLEDLAAEGKAVVMVSSDLRELLALCDRILVLSAGRVTGLFPRAEFDQDRIMAAALSGYRQGNG